LRQQVILQQGYRRCDVYVKYQRALCETSMDGGNENNAWSNYFSLAPRHCLHGCKYLGFAGQLHGCNW